MSAVVVKCIPIIESLLNSSRLRPRKPFAIKFGVALIATTLIDGFVVCSKVISGASIMFLSSRANMHDVTLGSPNDQRFLGTSRLHSYCRRRWPTTTTVAVQWRLMIATHSRVKCYINHKYLAPNPQAPLCKFHGVLITSIAMDVLA
jgi:hypothetical protein